MQNMPNGNMSYSEIIPYKKVFTPAWGTQNCSGNTCFAFTGHMTLIKISQYIALLLWQNCNGNASTEVNVESSIFY